jgi:hypothetical protein
MSECELLREVGMIYERHGRISEEITHSIFPGACAGE